MGDKTGESHSSKKLIRRLVRISSALNGQCAWIAKIYMFSVPPGCYGRTATTLILNESASDSVVLWLAIKTLIH